MVDLSISIVNYQTKSLLKECLQAIINNTYGISYEIIVVDNGSNDGSVDMVEKEFPQVRLIKNTENIFFARAHNESINIAKGEYICILNSDTIVPRDTLRILCEKIRENKSIIGAIGCKLLSDINQVQQTLYKRVTISNLLSLSKYLSRILRPFLPTRHYHTSAYDKEGFVEVLQDSLIVLPVSFIRQRGIYSPKLKLYNTEDQIAEEVTRAGLKLLYIPSVYAVHLLSKSTQPEKNLSLIYKISRKDSYEFYKQYRGQLKAIVVYLLLSVDIVFIRIVRLMKCVKIRILLANDL